MPKTQTLYLDVVDELGNSLYNETEEKVHKQGLLHKELVVWFYTDGGGLIFKMKSRKSKIFPEMLDVTVGRYVDVDKPVEECVVEAIKKQTYMDISIDKLEYLGEYMDFAEDKMTGYINNSLNYIYAYNFQRDQTNLMQETVPGDGFYEYNINEFVDMEDTYLKRFVCFSEDSAGDASFQAIKNHLKGKNII